jgi:hypothetical protein
MWWESHKERKKHLENNITMDLKETEWRDIYWNYLAQNRDQWRVLVNTVINLQTP